MTKRPLLALMLLASLGMAQTSPDLNDLQLRKEQLQSDLQRLDRDLARTDSLSRFEAQNFVDQKNRYQADIGKRKNELASLQQKLAGVRAEIQKEQARESRAKLEVENWNARIKFFQTELERQARTLEALVQKSLPWQKDSRLDRVRALIRDLQAGTASPEEGFGRLRSLYDEEIRFGDEIVVQEQSVTRNNGALINVKLMRLGNVAMFYVDQDSKYYGVLKNSSDSKTQWIEELDFKQREVVRRAIEVKGGKLPPELSQLPFWISASPEVKP